METLNVTNEQAIEICDNVGQTLVEQLDTDEVWAKVEQKLADYLKSNNINVDAADLTDRLEWSVKVRLRK
ncbi:MAG: hypothetical protein ACQCN4_09490 [Candidatus Bathyarchaeia archaeon]|jgi:hypothetical protein